MVKIGIGLRFPGTCEQAFMFYQSVFGGELFMLQRFKEMKEHGYTIEPQDEEKIAFVGLKVRDEVVFGGDDDSKSFPRELIIGNNISLGVNLESKAEADRIYNALSAGATDKSPMADMYWGEYTGSFKDKFGIWWGVSYQRPRE